MEEPAPNERPYRSHLRPACLPCRRRKSRCQSDAASAACLMCRAHRTECVYPSSKSTSQRLAESERRRGLVRLPSSTPDKTASSVKAVSRPGAADVPPASTDLVHPRPPLPPPPAPIRDLGRGPESASAPIISPRAASNAPWLTGSQVSEEESPLALGSADDQQHNLHIVGPAVTNDSQVLSEYLSTIPGTVRGPRMILPVPASRSRPVLFTMVQKRPVGLTVNRSPAAEKLETIEKLLEPHLSDVIDV